MNIINKNIIYINYSELILNNFINKIIKENYLN